MHQLQDRHVFHARLQEERPVTACAPPRGLGETPRDARRGKWAGARGGAPRIGSVLIAREANCAPFASSSCAAAERVRTPGAGGRAGV